MLMITTTTTTLMKINLIYMALFDSDGILTAQYIVIKYIQTCTHGQTWNNHIHTHISRSCCRHLHVLRTDILSLSTKLLQTFTWRQNRHFLIIIINLIYIAQFDTNGILTALYIVIRYIQTQ